MAFKRNPTPPVKDGGIARSLRSLGRISENKDIPAAFPAGLHHQLKTDGISLFKETLAELQAAQEMLDNQGQYARVNSEIAVLGDFFQKQGDDFKRYVEASDSGHLKFRYCPPGEPQLPFLDGWEILKDGFHSWGAYFGTKPFGKQRERELNAAADFPRELLGEYGMRATRRIIVNPNPWYTNQLGNLTRIMFRNFAILLGNEIFLEKYHSQEGQ